MRIVMASHGSTQLLLVKVRRDSQMKLKRSGINVVFKEFFTFRSGYCFRVHVNAVILIVNT